MENKDFRHRLYNEESEFNTDAWKQMESLLDTTSAIQQGEGEKKEKKKRFFFWFLCLGIGLLMSGGLYLFYTISSMDGDQNLSNVFERVLTPPIDQTEANIDHETFSDNSFKSTDNNRLEVISDYVKERKKQSNSEEGILLETRKTQSDQVKSIALNNQRDVVKTQNASSPIKQKIIDQNIPLSNKSIAQEAIINRVEKGLGKGTDSKLIIEGGVSDSNKKADQFTDSSLSKIGENRSKTEFLKEQGLILENQAIKSDEQIENDLPQSIDRDAIAALQSLERKSNVGLHFDRLLDPANEMVEPVKVSKLFLLVSGGYAQLNNKPGFIVGAGVVYDLDRILDFETNVSYAYGRVNVIDDLGFGGIGSQLSTEREIDINFLVHLNFIKNSTNKLSFDLGFGYSFFTLNRILSRPNSEDEEVEFKSNGRNIQGRISYQYFLNENRAIGIQGGAVSYNDAVAYISFKYINRF